MSYNLNEFKPSDVKGRLENPTNLNTVSAIISPTSTEKFYGATAVKMLADGFVEKAGDTDSVFAIVVYNEIKNERIAGQGVECAIKDCHYIAEASMDLDANVPVKIVSTGDKVALGIVGTDNIIGKTFAPVKQGGFVTIILDL